MKTMTLFGLLDQYSVLIPHLQRNYVHGRDDAHAEEVRKHFVKSLDECINGAEMNLGAIYGVCDGTRDVLILIDGQQRLTTLWLSAAYAVSTSKGNASQLDLLSKLSRFSYESRPLAAAFCRWLTSGADFEYDTALLQAEDCWGEDPTVHSMITTLRLIHYNFKSKADVLLKVLREGKIHFKFSEVYGNDSDLYVKINARGKQLTQWENFKGAFASHLTDDNDRKSFESEIETLSDKFFDAFTAIPDKAFFSLFGRITDYVLRTGKTYGTGETYELSQHENLSTLAKGVDCYVPVEEFDLEKTAGFIVEPVLRMLRWVLGLPATVSLWYWGAERRSKSVAEALFDPKTEDERDFALFLFEYFSRYADATGLSGNSYRALRFVANVLENVSREQEMKLGETEYSPANQFNRVKSMAGFLDSNPNLYEADVELPDNAPMQYREEFAKGQIYKAGIEFQIRLLQDCESYMHGRVRIALFRANAALNGWDCVLATDLLQDRLSVFKRRIDEWRLADEGRRIDLLKVLISCEPWEIRNQITLATDVDALRYLLSTQDDVHLQGTYLDGEQVVDERWKENFSWRRDWRKNVFDMEDWNGRTVKWHGGTGTYFLYAKGKSNVQNAMPVADWRFDLWRSIGSDFAEVGKVGSVSSNDGGTRSFKCEWREVGDNLINIYLWKEGVEIRWFNYDGDKQKSEWIEIKCERVDGHALACEIKNHIQQMKDDRQ